jgi:hypothetical protein
MTIQSGIDLNTCVPGQKVRLRNGVIVEYNEPVEDSWNTPYQHIVNFCSYMNDGCYWKGKRKDENDVVEILPLESKQSQILTEQIDIVNPDHVTIVPGEQSVVITIKKGKSTITWHIEG